MMFHVFFKRLNEFVPRPRYYTSGAAAFDLEPIDDLTLDPGEIVRANTGLVIKTPPDHVLFITHRSSTPVRHGVIVFNGIVDEDYCGDEDWLGIQVWNFTQNPVEIPAGTRIAQGLFIPVSRSRFFLADAMPNPSRGGYGSTG
jgi:dUTP pyrophosphatase